MPYIDSIRKRQLLQSMIASNPGDLTFLLTKIIINYINNKYRVDFRTIAEVLGSLDATQLEFSRRVVVPYEEKKIKENGDVYN